MKVIWTRIVLLALLAVAAASMGEEGSAMDIPSAETKTGGTVLRLSRGPHLFIDDFLIAESENLERVTHHPKKLPDPVLAKAEPWHQQPLFFLTVRQDPREKRFRIWYNVKNPGADEVKTAYAYAESRDGIHWVRKPLGIITLSGQSANNLFFASGYSDFGLCLIDDAARSAAPEQRYKMAFYRNGEGEGLHVAYSPDGLHFTPHPENPIVTHADFGDIVDGCWDPLKQRYLLCHKYHAHPEDGYTGTTPNVPFEGYRRLVGQVVSTDFVHWTAPRKIVAPRADEPGVWEFYGMVPRIRNGLYLGFLRVLRDDLTAEPDGPVRGIGWTEICTSRDGETWTRWRDPFLDRGDTPGLWDRAMAWFGDIVTVGDEEFIYYGGYSQGHKVGDRQIGLAKLRKNGFVSRAAGDSPGRLLTPPLALDAKRITVNADVDGKVRVRLVGETGEPLEGCNWGDALPIKGDSVTHPLVWRRDFEMLDKQSVRLEFVLQNAHLYGFNLE